MTPDELVAALAATIAAGDTVGASAHDVANHTGRSLDDVLIGVSRALREGLIESERSPLGSEFYGLTEAGEAALAQQQSGDERTEGLL